MNLANITVRGKIILLASVLGVFLFITCAAGFYAVNNLTTEIAALHKNEMQQGRMINAARTYIRAIEASMIELLLADNTAAEQDALRRQLSAYEKDRQAIISIIDATNLSGQERELFQRAQQHSASALQGRQEAFRLLDAGNRTAAWQVYRLQAQTNIDKSNALLKELSEAADQSASQAEHRAANLSRASFVLLSVLTVLALLFGALAAFFIARAITRPLARLANQAHLIANGDLSAKALPVAGTDEIARLTASFNDMTAHLHELVANSLDTAEKTASASEELTASGEQCAVAATQITNAIGTVSEAALRQQAHVETTSAAIQEISASIQEIAATAESFSHVSDTTSVAARDGETTVRQAVSQIQSVAEETLAVQRLMTDLNDSSRKISEIVTLITGIANQTNLLALNAAIEAARAGEQGRGFAVVAEEVRKLAEDSAKAAHHIGELVQANEVQVSQVAATTNHTVQALQSGQTTVEQAGQQFSQIADTVANLAKEMREISQSVEEAAKGAQSIVGSAALIDTETKQVSSEVQQITAAMEEQSASLEEVSTAGQDLANLAEALLRQVHRFRL